MPGKAAQCVQVRDVRTDALISPVFSNADFPIRPTLICYCPA